MSNSRQPETAYFIELAIKRQGDHLTITSPDLPELNLCSADIPALFRDIPRAIVGIFKINRSLDVRVVSIGEVENLLEPTPALEIPADDVATIQRIVAFTHGSSEAHIGR